MLDDSRCACTSGSLPLRASLGFLLAVALCSATALPCTTLLVDEEATADGSTFVTYSCDGGIFAGIRVVPSATHAPGSSAFLFDDVDFFESTAIAKPEPLGSIPQIASTYRYLDTLAGPALWHLGGMNEHGLAIAETTLGGTRPELANPHGLLAPFSACPERSLMTLALQRARTAREAIHVIGELAEMHGYHSTFPMDGEQFAISDGLEVWSMEILGPGPDWRPGSGAPGAVWCAQRVPEGHVGVSANRSRIGEVDLSDTEWFLASPNVKSLAEDMGWWNPQEVFVWSEAYAPSNAEQSRIREWRVFDLVAPSLRLSPEEPLPFSVKPDRLLSAANIMAIQRDTLEGTVYDVTAKPAFSANAELSPLACPMCHGSLYDLLGLEPARTINNRASSLSCIYQTSADLAPELRGCTWVGFGPAATTCYTPIYTGVTELPEKWGSLDVADGDLSLPFWTMCQPGYLATAQWQNAFPDLQAVRDPAEARFLEERACLSDRVESWAADGDTVATQLNAYTCDRLAEVLAGFEDLAAHLLIEYVIGLGRFSTLPAPAIELPDLP